MISVYAYLKNIRHVIKNLLYMSFSAYSREALNRIFVNLQM